MKLLIKVISIYIIKYKRQKKRRNSISYIFYELYNQFTLYILFYILFVKFDHDGEYYSIDDSSHKQNLGSFVKFLEECCIIL